MVVMLKEIKKISNKINTVMALLAAGDIQRLSNGDIQAHDAVFKTLLDQAEYQVGIAIFEKKGYETPEHAHEKVVQYIIQYKGSTAAYFADGGFRIVETGQCVSIPPGLQHKFVAITDDAEQIWVCIPAEAGYKKEL